MRNCTYGMAWVVIVLSALWPVAAASRKDRPDPGWQVRKAENYLDDRAEAWLTFSSANRGEGASKTSCVSCHTLFPFAMARPVLRRQHSADTPTASESTLLRQVQLRVSRWSDLDSPALKLMYDFNDQKKTESWGTEAVLNATILALDDRYQNRATPSDATLAALSNLWAKQATDGPEKGSWDWLNFNLEPWEATNGRYFGAALAAIGVGMVPGYAAHVDPALMPKVDLLRRYLNDKLDGQNLHNRTWALWAASHLDGVLHVAEKQAVIAQILAAQEEDGGWCLPKMGSYVRGDGTGQEMASDGYATGLVLHVLQRAGMPRDDPRVAKGLAWLRSNQADTGAWRTSSVNKRRDPTTNAGKFMTDAATGFAVLALSH